jgi:hypothetical protein
MATTRLPPDFREFLKLLAAHSVRYLLIGGYAVNAYGYIRNTVDMDIWIAGDPENQMHVVDAIRKFAFPGASADLLQEDDAMVRMGVPPLRIEILSRSSSRSRVLTSRSAGRIGCRSMTQRSKFR